MSRRTTIRRSAVLAAVTALAALVSAQAASAAVIERDHFTVSIVDVVNVDEECESDHGDLAYSLEARVALRVVQRGPKGGEAFSMNFQRRVTWTNEAGQRLTAQLTLLDKDLSVVDNGDGTVTLIVLLTGGYHARGSNGVINADPGQTRLALTFDEEGKLIDEQIVKGSTGRNDASSLCDDLAAAFG